MRVRVLCVPGSPDRPNEDAAAATVTDACAWVAVADGATARTETGCVHGVAWFAARLVEGVDAATPDLSAALRAAIVRTADLHRDTCDLADAATPGAAVAIVAVADEAVRFLVLGDVTVVVEGADGLSVVTDERVSRTASAERAVADALPQGSAAKAAALVAMKRAELAARNVPGGFWAAASDPDAVDQALTWTLPRSAVKRVAILTDGAARAVEPFALTSWAGLLDLLADEGPAGVIRLVREAEQADPAGLRWIRNKTSDDATAVYLDEFH